MYKNMKYERTKSGGGEGRTQKTTKSKYTYVSIWKWLFYYRNELERLRHRARSWAKPFFSFLLVSIYPFVWSISGQRQTTNWSHNFWILNLPWKCRDCSWSTQCACNWAIGFSVDNDARNAAKRKRYRRTDADKVEAMPLKICLWFCFLFSFLFRFTVRLECGMCGVCLFSG